MKFFILNDSSHERRSFFTQLNHFINNERWNKMAEYLVNQENSKWYHQERRSLLNLGSKSSLLYKACCVSAPLDIIKMLLRVVSVDLVKYRSNHQNDFPLHAAARHGDRKHLRVCTICVTTVCLGPKIQFFCGNCTSKWGIPRTGYLVPGCEGPGSLPNGESCWDVAVAVTWKFRLTFRPGNYF